MAGGKKNTVNHEGSKNGFSCQKFNYKSLFDSLNIGIAVLHPESFKIVEINRCFSGLSGFDSDYFQGKNILKISLFEDKKQFIELLDKLKNGNSPSRKGITIKTKSGTKLDLELSVDFCHIDDQELIQCQFLPLIKQVKSTNQNEEEIFRLESIVENSEDAIISKDFSGTIKTWNKAAERIFGYKSKEAIGQNISKIIPEELIQEEHEIDRKIRKGERISNYETVRIRKDGSTIQISLTVSPIKNLKGEIIGVSKIAHDITKRKKAEEAVRESEKQLRRVLDSLFIFVGLALSDGTLVEVNKPPLEAAGINREEVLGVKAWETFWVSHDPKAQKQMRKDYEKVRQGEIIRHDLELQVKDGGIVTIDYMLAPVHDRTGNITHIISSGVDITERKRAEKELLKSEERFRSLVEATSQLVWHADAMGKTIGDINWESLVGLKRTKKRGWKDFVHPKDRQRVLNEWSQSLEHSTIFESEFRLLHKDATYHHFVSRGIPIFEGKKVCEWVGTVSDITIRKRAEEGLRESEGRFRNLADTAPVLIWMNGTDKNYFYFNKIWLEFTGRQIEEECGNGWTKSVHPDDLENCLKTRIGCFDARKEFEVEYRLRRFDGEYRWVLDKGVPRFTINNEFLGYIGSCLDITERKLTEEKLKESEARFRQLTEGLPLLVWTCRGEDGYCDYLSSQWVGYTGIPEEPQLGFGWLEQIHPDDRERTVNEWNRAVSNNKDYHDEFRIRRYDGVYRWFQTRAVPLCDTSGKIVKWFGTNTDIDDLNATREALRFEMERLEKTAAVSPGIINSFRTLGDGGLTFSYASPRIYEIYGKTPEELKEDASNVWDLIHPDDRRQIIETIEKSALLMTNWHNIWRVINPQKGEIWVEGYSAPIIEQDGNLTWHGVLNDVTERKKIEEQIIESERRYRLMFENNPLPMWVYDLETLKFIAVNDAAVSHYGYSRQEFLSMTLKNIRPHEDIPALLEDVVTVRSKLGKPVFSRHLKKNGTLIDVEIVSHGMIFDGRIARLVLANDITERKKAEKMILELNETLERKVSERTSELNAVNKELEAFSYSVSHDLRAPLRAVDGFSLALLEDYEDKLDNEGKNYLHRVHSASQKMAQLIDDLLKLSRISRGELKRETVNLSNIVKEITDRLQEIQPKSALNLRIEENVKAFADERLLHIALENLLNNAWKFTSKKETAEISFGHKIEDGEIAYFVGDNGAGFDMAFASKLFGAFQRLHTTQEFEGTGIGLATVQRIINRHGGRIWAESKVGEGTVFYFILGN